MICLVDHYNNKSEVVWAKGNDRCYCIVIIVATATLNFLLYYRIRSSGMELVYFMIVMDHLNMQKKPFRLLWKWTLNSKKQMKFTFDWVLYTNNNRSLNYLFRYTFYFLFFYALVLVSFVSSCPLLLTYTYNIVFSLYSSNTTTSFNWIWYLVPNWACLRAAKGGKHK